MKIWVAVKRVPDTAARIRPDATGQGVDASDVKFVLNPYDEFAVEEALKLREQAGEGEVNVISVGPAESLPVLRQALAMGADRAVRVDGSGSLDSLQLARALAAVAAREEPDLVLSGKLAVDDECGQVPAMLAGLLGWPQATQASSICLLYTSPSPRDRG